jgi:hypothetical protein
VRSSEHRPVRHDSSCNDGFVALQRLLVGVLGAAPHVDHPYPAGGQFLDHLLELDQTWRILAEARVVRGEPADEKVACTQSELGSDGLVTYI